MNSNWNGFFHEGKVVKLLSKELLARWSWYSQNYSAAARQWLQTDEFTRSYLSFRAADIFSYGEDVTDLAFAQPTFAGADTMVSSLVSLLKYAQEQDLIAEKEKLLAEEMVRIETECASDIAKLPETQPSDLALRVLTQSEIELVKRACQRELTQKQDWNGEAALKALYDLVHFCDLISMPENHILVSSGQYVFTPVNTRQYTDMEKEMAYELTKLDPRIAYANVLQEVEGVLVVQNYKIKAPPPPPKKDAGVEISFENRKNSSGELACYMEGI
jgi:hypothetical protein